MNSWIHSPKELLGRLATKINSETCFIIGGGPSKNTVLPDNSILDGKMILACNNAYKIFPNALCCHFADELWFNWHKTSIYTEFRGELTTSSLIYNERSFWATRGVTCFGKADPNHNDTIGITLNPHFVCGSNTGHQTINIAVHLGFKKIVLIGFDMHSVNDKTQWHNEHKRSTNTEQYTHTMIPGMKKIPQWEEKYGPDSLSRIQKNIDSKCIILISNHP